jgi:transcription elongation GreA/GreB family factor
LARLRAGLETRRAGYARELASLDEAAAGETKSSAGDKYEPAREMIAQSRRLIEGNLSETAAGLDALDRMAAAPPGPKAGFGSLVETSQGWYLMGASLGETEIDGIAVRTVSLASPLGAAMKGRQAGERAPWRGTELAILRVGGA